MDPEGENNTFQDKYNQFIQRIGQKVSLIQRPLLCKCLGELFGTMIYIIFGLGVDLHWILNRKVIGKWPNKSMSISIGWGIANTLGLLLSGILGLGLMNPALTFAFALVGKVPFKYVGPVTCAQFIGAFLGGLIVLGIYNENIFNYVKRNSVEFYVMQSTGYIFVTSPVVTHKACFVDHLLSTAIYAALSLAILDKNNYFTPSQLQPIYSGILVIGVIGSLCINTQAALNPARDLGPRIMIAMCGWGWKAFTASNYYFWIPLVGPYTGAIIGSIAYELIIGFHINESQKLNPLEESETKNATVFCEKTNNILFSESSSNNCTIFEETLH